MLVTNDEPFTHTHSYQNKKQIIRKISDTPLYKLLAV